MKNILRLTFLMLFAFGGLAYSANPPLDPEIISETGTVEIPFTQNISAEQIQKLLTEMIADEAKIDEIALNKLVSEKIRQAVDFYKKNTPDAPVIDEKEILDFIKKGFDLALKKVTEGIVEYNKAVEAGILKAANKGKALLDEKTPSIWIYSNYTYEKGKRDSGSPGWTNPPAISGSPAAITIIGGAGLNIGISLDPEVFGNKIGGVSFDIIGEFDFAAGFETTGFNPNISPLNRPQATASIQPAIKYTFDIVGKAGFIVSIKGGQAKSDYWRFNTLGKEIVAVPPIK
jgi:hypothetical protein